MMSSLKLEKLKDLHVIKPGSEINLFICYSPFQVYVANSIITRENNSSATSILIKQSQITVAHSFTSYLDIRPGYRKISDMKFAKNILDFIAKKFSNVNYFIPHTGGLLSYYIYDSLKNRHRHIKVNLYYEGILFLYQADKNYLRNTVNIRGLDVVSILLGLNFKFSGNIYPGNSEKIDKIYTPFPDETLGDKSKMSAIKLKDNTHAKFIPGRVIILGQHFTILNDEQHTAIFTKMIDDLVNDNFTDVFYKPHYSENSNAFDSVAKEKGLEYKKIPPYNPIEEVIDNYHPQRVVSMISSSLVNLKGLYGDELEMRCYCPALSRKTIQSENLKNAKEIFLRLGIPNTEIRF